MSNRLESVLAKNIVGYTAEIPTDKERVIFNMVCVHPQIHPKEDFRPYREARSFPGTFATTLIFTHFIALYDQKLENRLGFVLPSLVVQPWSLMSNVLRRTSSPIRPFIWLFQKKELGKDKTRSRILVFHTVSPCFYVPFTCKSRCLCL